MIVDTREAELIRFFTDEKVEIEVKQLSVGDIWIGDLIIERKSIRDLEASILDGRYREQRGRILAYCQENKTQPMYILGWIALAYRQTSNKCYYEIHKSSYFPLPDSCCTN